MDGPVGTGGLFLASALVGRRVTGEERTTALEQLLDEIEKIRWREVDGETATALLGRYLAIIRDGDETFAWRRAVARTALNFLSLQLPAEALAVLVVSRDPPTGGDTPVMSELDDRFAELQAA